MRNIIFDGDPGHDDTMAFLIAMGNPDKFKVLGFTTVCGNSTVENCSRNILKIIDFLGEDIPVATGFAYPLVKELDTAAKFHGETGLDGLLMYPDATSKPVSKHAVEFLRDTILNSEEKITLVTMGPLTNIAMLLKTYPEVKGKIEDLVMMGGSYGSGNALAKGEFNMYCDPEAAKIVFDSGVKITMATTEACYSGGVLLTEQELFKNGGRVSQLAYNLLKFYSRYAVNNGWDRTAIYDMTTMIYLCCPEMYEYKDMRVDIELNGEYTRGMTVCDDRGPTYIGKPENPKRVLLNCDREKLVEIMFDSFKRLDEIYGE